MYKVVHRRDRRGYVLRFRDAAGNIRQRRLQSTRLRDAEREAARLEDELVRSIRADSWLEFRAAYESQHLAARSPDTTKKWLAVASWVERVIRPSSLDDVDAPAIRQIAAAMRTKCAEASIKSYLASLKAALRWAAAGDMIRAAPRFPVIKIVDTTEAGGRPITTEEFERMLAACVKVVGARNAAGWRYLLRGLWLSGLRPRDALELYWDRPDRQMIVDLDAKWRKPKIRMHGELQKTKRDQYLPVTPDFAALLLETPAEDRTGAVFRPWLRRAESRNVSTWSKRITDIGRAANVISKHRVDGTVKYASAKDLRRAFGTRWAPRVRPIRLMQMMRHKSLDTTMRYYVALDVEDTLEEIWAAAGDQSGDQATFRFSNQIAKDRGSLGRNRT